MKDRAIAGFVILCAFAISYPLIAKSYQFSPTFDEPFYLKAGLTWAETGSNKMLMKAGTMPLPIMVQRLPILGESSTSVSDQTQALLNKARPMTLIFWLWLLISAYALANRWGGPWAALATLFLIATEPNLIAHAGLMTTDIAVTAGCVWATLIYDRGRGQGWWQRVALPGVAYGIAILCKASALAFVPIIWMCIECHGVLTTGFRGWWRTAWRILPSPIAVIIGLAVVFLVCGSDWQRERTFVEWANTLNDGNTKSTMIWLSDHLRIFTNAGEAIAQQIKHNMRGHGCYLNGDWHHRAVPWYFFVAIAAKLTLPALIAIVGTGTMGVRGWLKTPAGWIAIALLLFTLNCRVQIGIRLVFPLVTFLLITSAIVITQTRFRWLIIPMIVSQLAFTIHSRHDLIRHFNPMFGGPDGGHQYLSDSNCDWGQGLNQLNDRELCVWYFGDGFPKTGPLILVQFHTFPAKATIEDFKKALNGRPLAVSTSILFDNPNRSPAGKLALEWLKAMEPVEKLGPFFVYRFD